MTFKNSNYKKSRKLNLVFYQIKYVKIKGIILEQREKTKRKTDDRSPDRVKTEQKSY